MDKLSSAAAAFRASSSTPARHRTRPQPVFLLGSYTGGSWQQLTTSSLGLLTTQVAEGSNLYFTANRVASVIAGTTTDALAQGATNKYYSDALTRSALSWTATGLTYTSPTVIDNHSEGVS